MGAIDNHYRHREGYLFFGVAATLVVAAVVLVAQYSYPSTVLLGPLPPVAVLTYFGIRRLRTADTEDRSPAPRESSREASVWALLLLFGVMSADWFLQLVPPEGRPTVYLAVGGSSFFLFYGYYRLSSR